MARRRDREDPEPELTESQELELCDPGAAVLAEKLGSAFASPEARRQAWAAHGSRLVREYKAEHPGKRPVMWWEVEAPRKRPVVMEDRPPGAPRDLPNEAAWLLELGELGEAERGRCPPPNPAERAYMEGA